MARGLDRIWIRFGLWIAATVLVTVGILGVSVVVFAQYQYQDFYRNLPLTVRQEFDILQKTNLKDSPRAIEIYGEYWEGDLLLRAMGTFDRVVGMSSIWVGHRVLGLAFRDSTAGLHCGSG